MNQSLSFLVVTVSDRASAGLYADESGPAVEEELRSAYPTCQVDRIIVSDEAKQIRKVLVRGESFDVVLTTGGTGPGPRDNTPEITEELCDRALPGIAEMLRAESRKEVPTAVLSRGYAGIRRDDETSTIYVNLPGSKKGAQSCARLLLPVLEHAVAMAGGGAH